MKIKKFNCKKRIIAIIGVVLILCINVAMIVPAYAHDGTAWYIYFVDSVNDRQYQVEVNMLDDSYYIRIDMDSTTGTIKIWSWAYGLSEAQKELVYEFYYVTGVTYNIDAYNDGDSEVLGTLGYGSSDTYITGVIGRQNPYVNVIIEYTSANYGIDQYGSGVNYGKNQGRQEVINDPNEYGLYTSQQYQEALNGNANNTDIIVGLANVGLSSIFTYFTYFVNQTGIFGVSLAGIVITCVIILLVYTIFKIVKG